MAFLRRVLPPAPLRLLDVGCGRGDLAARLASEGFEVTALDNSPDAIQRAREAGVPAVEADFLSYEDAPHDAVLFSRSLHHIHPLQDAVARAAALLKPGGWLIAEEFARERADRATATWFYDTRSLLRAAGLLDVAEEESALSDPMERWRADHATREGHPLHEASAMLAEITRRFENAATEDAAYLYWYLTRWLEESQRGYDVASRLLAIETRRIADGSLRPIGLRVVARHRAELP